MNYSPTYRASQLREIQNTLREVRFSLARILETAACAEIKSLDELILMIADLRTVTAARVAGQSPPPWGRS